MCSELLSQKVLKGPYKRSIGPNVCDFLRIFVKGTEFNILFKKGPSIRNPTCFITSRNLQKTGIIGIKVPAATSGKFSHLYH